MLQRCQSSTSRPPTRIIALDRFPADDTEADTLFDALADPAEGTLPDGWGEVSPWPTERIRAGDWSAAVWRAKRLATAAARYAERETLRTLASAGLSSNATGRQLRGAYRPSTAGLAGSFPIMKSKSGDAQKHIEGYPDEHWTWQRRGDPPILSKAGHLLITAGQDPNTGRLTAVASDNKYAGNGWMPITGTRPEIAKALAVFINSTAGRLLIMRDPGRKLSFFTYSAGAADALPIPDVSDPRIVSTLAECWEATRHMVVPQFRDGYTEVRRRWDAAVCDALEWDINEVTELGLLLAREPHVRGVAYGQWKA